MTATEIAAALGLNIARTWNALSSLRGTSTVVRRSRKDHLRYYEYAIYRKKEQT